MNEKNCHMCLSFYSVMTSYQILEYNNTDGLYATGNIINKQQVLDLFKGIQNGASTRVCTFCGKRKK